MMDTTPNVEMEEDSPSLDSTFSPSNNTQNTTTVPLLLYVVQKCWFSGPQTFDPADYGRLLDTAAAAETVAYQSAHAYAAARGEVVRTLQLQQPAKGSSSSGAASSYGFLAAGALFWTRAVTAAVVGEWNTAHGAQVLLGTKHTLWSAVGQNRVAQQQQQSSAHPVTVFCGKGAAAAAQQAIRQLPDCGSSSIAPRVAWWPVGPPPADSWRKEWQSSAVAGPNEPVYLQPGASQKRTVAATTVVEKTAAAPVLLSWNALNVMNHHTASPQQTCAPNAHEYRPTKQRRVHHHHPAAAVAEPPPSSPPPPQAMMW